MEGFSGRKMHIQNNNQDGQSAIEFILTVAFALGVTFLFVNQALNMTAGYYAHWVNYKASRVYLVYEDGVDLKSTNINKAIAAAQNVFKKSELKAFGVNGTLKVITTDQANAVFTGTVLEFKRSLSSLPVVGGGEKARFYSESFLGKEPLRITCAEMTCAAITGSITDCRDPEKMDIVLYDNGC